MLAMNPFFPVDHRSIKNKVNAGIQLYDREWNSRKCIPYHNHVEGPERLHYPARFVGTRCSRLAIA